MMTFERRYPSRIEPLMGWTEESDPLTQLELSFPSAETATAYARRHGLRYTLYPAPDHDQQWLLPDSENPEAADRDTIGKRDATRSPQAAHQNRWYSSNKGDYSNEPQAHAS